MMLGSVHCEDRGISTGSEYAKLSLSLQTNLGKNRPRLAVWTNPLFHIKWRPSLTQIINTDTPMRILIAEDDEVLADGLCTSMRQSGYAVDCVKDGLAAKSILTGEQPFDLVILDLGLPKVDGFSVLRSLRENNWQVPVIILTARDAEGDRVKGLDLGADDYMIKPFSLRELEARVRALIRRGQCGVNPMYVCSSLVFDSIERRATINGTPLELTTRELSVLEALILRTGKVVTKEQLIERVYSYSEEASNNAIEVYVHRLRKKVEPAGVTIRTVRGLGYIIENLTA
jgi:two-component system OmpR family response regulator